MPTAMLSCGSTRGDEMAKITDIDYTDRTIRIKNPPWPYFHLEVCRGHEVRRPWFLRWLWPKLRFHAGPHPVDIRGLPGQSLYSFLVEEWS